MNTTTTTTPALYFIVTTTEDGYSAARESVRVVLADTLAQAEAVVQATVDMYTWRATLYAVTDEGYRGERLAEARYTR